MKLHVHRDAVSWAPSPEDRRRLERAFPDSAYEAWIAPRSLIGSMLGAEYAEVPMAFRALTRPGHTSIVFVDPPETRASATWVLAHELGHQLLQDAPEHKAALARRRPQHLDPKSDAFHREDPEERFADAVAVRVLGTKYDRPWWRRRAGTPAGSDQYGRVDGASFP